jgi:hypothetical protein
VAAILVTALACNPTSVNSGAATTCTVTLNQAAPTGGTVVARSDNKLPPRASSLNSLRRPVRNLLICNTNVNLSALRLPWTTTDCRSHCRGQNQQGDRSSSTESLVKRPLISNAIQGACSQRCSQAYDAHLAQVHHCRHYWSRRQPILMTKPNSMTKHALAILPAVPRSCARCGDRFRAFGREYCCPACRKPAVAIHERANQAGLSFREKQIVALIRQAKNQQGDRLRLVLRRRDGERISLSHIPKAGSDQSDGLGGRKSRGWHPADSGLFTFQHRRERGYRRNCSSNGKRAYMGGASVEAS